MAHNTTNAVCPELSWIAAAVGSPMPMIRSRLATVNDIARRTSVAVRSGYGRTSMLRRLRRATQLPSAACSSDDARELGLTRTRSVNDVIATLLVHAHGMAAVARSDGKSQRKLALRFFHG